MDGFKRRLNESVQLKLSFMLSISILVVATLAGGISFFSALHEAHELQDDLLRQVAQLMGRQHLSLAAPAVGESIENGDDDSRVTVQRLVDSSLSAPSAAAAGKLPIPANLADGLHTLELGGESFRVMIKTTAAGERFAVAQEGDFRNKIARDGALRTVMPFLILVPVLLLIVGDLVRKMFRPIAVLSKEVDSRAEQELHPVKERQLPAEVRPFAMAINRLLERVGQAMASQRRFVADAAHELRSPLTALSLQAERLAEAEMSASARERLTVLRQGIERGRSLIDQLLALAKAQSPTPAPRLPVSIQKVFRRVLEDLMPLADAKRIDIGVEGAHEVEILTNELDLIVIVKNLVDNAIRYTPAGGRVDLSAGLFEGTAELRIEDNGPGISLAERERVFDPFYRTLGNAQQGSGLGLSIVQAIADRIGAEIHLEFSDKQKQKGLSAIVRFPLIAAGDKQAERKPH